MTLIPMTRATKPGKAPGSPVERLSADQAALDAVIETAASGGLTGAQAINLMWTGTMPVFCCVCGKQYATKACLPEMGGKPSHGICGPECKTRYTGGVR